MDNDEIELNKWRKLAQLGVSYDYEIARLEERLADMKETVAAIWFAVENHPRVKEIRQGATDE